MFSLSSLFNPLLDLVFPPRCAVCRAFIKADPSLCPACDAAWPVLKEPCCEICAEPFVSGPSHRCGDCLQDPPPFERLRAAGLYEGSLLDLVIRLKYRGEERLAALLGRKMAAAIVEADSSFDVIVPIPLHVSRLRERGFNQAALLAKAIGRKTKIPVDLFAFRKHRTTIPQAQLKKDERRKNLKGAFQVRNAKSLEGKTILLVDDVATTGETLREAARVLKQAGAKRVEALVAARAE